MKKTIITSFGLLLLVAALIFGNSVFGTGDKSFIAGVGFSSVDKDAPIKIGAALGQSGICAEWGEGELRAAQLAAEESNMTGGIAGRKIELILEDTQCDPKGAVNAMKKLIEVNHVEAIIGLTWGDSFQAGYTISEPAKVVVVSPSTAIEVLLYNKLPIAHIFSTDIPTEVEVSALLRYLAQTEKKSFVVVHDQDPYGLMIAAHFRDQALEHELQVIKDYEVPINYGDFRTLIARIKAANPDGVFISFQAPEPEAKFLKKAHDLGLTIPIFGTHIIQDEGLLKDFGKGMDGIVYAYPKSSGSYEVFKKKYVARYGSDPQGPTAPNAYDAMRVLIAGLTLHHTNGVELKDAIESTDLPGTVSKELQFNGAHMLSGMEFEIKTVRDGKFVVVR